MPVVPSFDTVGGMAKIVKNVADLIGLLSGGGDFASFLNGSWENARVGLVYPKIWQPAPIAVERRDDFLTQTVSLALLEPV